MSTLSINLPDSIHDKLKILAEKEGVSVNQFVTSAVSEKISSFDYLQKRANRGSRQAFKQIMSEVPDVEPEDYDKL